MRHRIRNLFANHGSRDGESGMVPARGGAGAVKKSVNIMICCSPQPAPLPGVARFVQGTRSIDRPGEHARNVGCEGDIRQIMPHTPPSTLHNTLILHSLHSIAQLCTPPPEPECLPFSIVLVEYRPISAVLLLLTHWPPPRGNLRRLGMGLRLGLGLGLGSARRDR